MPPWDYIYLQNYRQQLAQPVHCIVENWFQKRPFLFRTPLYLQEKRSLHEVKQGIHAIPE